MQTVNEGLLALARDTAAKFVAINARCDAAFGFAAALALRCEMSAEEIAAAQKRCVDYAYEKALHELENREPGLAAKLDLRTEIPLDDPEAEEA